jgi:hypothetical protein
VIEALILAVCIVWVWRSDVPRKTRLAMLLAVLPLISLIGRAYFLVNGVR